MAEGKVDGRGEPSQEGLAIKPRLLVVLAKKLGIPEGCGSGRMNSRCC